MGGYRVFCGVWYEWVVVLCLEVVIHIECVERLIVQILEYPLFCGDVFPKPSLRYQFVGFMGSYGVVLSV